MFTALNNILFNASWVTVNIFITAIFVLINALNIYRLRSKLYTDGV